MLRRELDRALVRVSPYALTGDRCVRSSPAPSPVAPSMVRTLTSTELAEALGISLRTAQRIVGEHHERGTEHATYVERPRGRSGRQIVSAVRMLVG